jgi:prevent-host-death family protein
VKPINIQAAKTHLSRLVEAAVQGEEIILAKAGKPMVRLVPYTRLKRPRRGGQMKDARLWLSPEFGNENSEINALFDDRGR